MTHRLSIKSIRGKLAPAVLAAALWPASVSAFDLGVQTHFAQGWPVSLLDRVDQAGTRYFRDGIHWEEIERTPGVYDFTPVRGWLEAARARGQVPLLTFAGANPLYDGGETPNSDAAQAAFARFVAATVAAFPDLTARIELGNEFNAPNFMSGAFEDDPAGNFARLAAAVHAEVKQVSPETEILCTGAHSVALAYFRGVFAAGGLDSCDAISLHPYRPEPEWLETELAALRALMAEYGPVRPIHATEFGKWFDDPAEAPAYMLKMVTVMAAADVAGAWWYALVDEPWWPNMGLLDEAEVEKPAAPAFRFLTERLLPLGRPRRLDATPSDRIYAFGESGRAIVVWGAPGHLIVEGAARYYDATGQEIAPVTAVGDAPVVLLGDALRVSVRRAVPVHDALLGFGQPPWSYVAIHADGTETALDLLETNWTPVLGNRYLRPLGVSPSAIGGVVFDGAPVAAVERFTAPASGRYRIVAGWTPQEAGGDGAVVTLRIAGRIVARATVRDGGFTLDGPEFWLKAGQALDFAVDPGAEPGGDALNRRIRIVGPMPGG